MLPVGPAVCWSLFPRRVRPVSQCQGPVLDYCFGLHLQQKATLVVRALRGRVLQGRIDRLWQDLLCHALLVPNDMPKS